MSLSYCDGNSTCSIRMEYEGIELTSSYWPSRAGSRGRPVFRPKVLTAFTDMFLTFNRSAKPYGKLTLVSSSEQLSRRRLVRQKTWTAVKGTCHTFNIQQRSAADQVTVLRVVLLGCIKDLLVNSLPICHSAKFKENALGLLGAKKDFDLKTRAR